MRPIQFRAYCEQHQQMYLPSEKPNEFPQLLLNQHGDVIEFFPQEGCGEGFVPHGSLYFARVGHALTVMQFTGLLDRHGKKIYEGDIIRWTDARGDDPGNVKTNVVVVEEGCFVVGEGTEDFIDGQQSEILGNIYEHPHLVQP